MAKKSNSWQDVDLDVSCPGCPICFKRRTLHIMAFTKVYRCEDCGYVFPTVQPVNSDMVADARVEMIAARRELADCELSDPDLHTHAAYWRVCRQAYAALVLAQGTPENYALMRMHDIVRHYQD